MKKQEVLDRKNPIKIQSSVTLQNADIANLGAGRNSTSDAHHTDRQIEEPKVVLNDVKVSKNLNAMGAQTSNISNDTFSHPQPSEKPSATNLASGKVHSPREQ
jgi:hypothetical protein